MEFEFAKYTEVTSLAHKVNPEYKLAGYSRLFICQDVVDTWLVRMRPGFNEEYERDEDSLLLERNNIRNDFKGQNMTISRARRILKNDEFDNWDYQVCEKEAEAIEMLEDGYGINLENKKQ